MCGIAASFAYRASSADADEVRRATDSMAPRGPDGEGLWQSPDGRAVLGHRRLAIIDLSAGGAQPMHSADGALSITFNGEIYNYRAVRERLEAAGAAFRSDSDTEVLLHLYAEKGERMVDDLRGMFAFALWDHQRGGLLLGRDPYGIKPLYVADDGRTLRAASQVRALRAMGGIDTAEDPAALAGFFLWGSIPEPHTIYRGVRALSAGHTQWIDADGPQPPRAFSTVRDTLLAAEAHPAAAADPQGALRDAMLDTVRAHLVADVDVGVFLSAGLDSTTLAALAAEVGGRLKTVTLGFDEYAGRPDDEVPLAESVAAHYGADHQTVRVGRDDFRTLLGDFLASMDQPSLDGLNSYLVSAAAARAGLKVALSGLGGDELFGGYPSFAEVPRLVGLTGWVPAPLGRAARALSAPLLSRLTSPKAAGLLEYGGSYGGAYLLRRGLFMPWELPAVMGADAARAGLEALRPVETVDAFAEGLRAPHLRVTAMESMAYMRNQLLRDTDWASMAHSLEVRVPLVDAHLLARVAPLLAAHPGLSKKDMARTPARPLPDGLLHRPKTGFTTPVRRWMLDDGAISEQDRGHRGWARFVLDRYRQGA
jgi:asparagine synthase (glutamine-hydrolysing)